MKIELKPTELPIDIETSKAFPSQRLEDKIGYIARIDHVSKEGEKFDIGIENKTGLTRGRSFLYLGHEDFKDFLDCYGLKTPSYLIGKPVISVYTRSMGR